MSANRVLGILELYLEKRSWTAEEIAKRLHVSVSTAYRYVRSLCHVGLLDPAGGGRSVLGPAIIEYDRWLRESDPLLTVAIPVMRRLAAQMDRDGVVVLTRLYRDRVMCVHQETSRGRDGEMAHYERGRPMSMFKGATSKVILAFLPDRKLKRLFLARPAELRAEQFGHDWKSFRVHLRQIRRAGHCQTVSEIAPNRTGIAAPIFGGLGVVGSLSIVTKARGSDPGHAEAHIRQVTTAAAQISSRLRKPGSKSEPPPAHNTAKPRMKSGAATRAVGQGASALSKRSLLSSKTT